MSSFSSNVASSKRSTSNFHLPYSNHLVFGRSQNRYLDASIENNFNQLPITNSSASAARALIFQTKTTSNFHERNIQYLNQGNYLPGERLQHRQPPNNIGKNFNQIPISNYSPSSEFSTQPTSNFQQQNLQHLNDTNASISNSLKNRYSTDNIEDNFNRTTNTDNSCSLNIINHNKFSTLDDVKTYLKENPAREAWSWISYSNKIVLTLISKKSLNIKTYVYIYSDLSATGSLTENSDPSDFFRIQNKIVTKEDFIHMQQKIEKKNICLGISIEIKRSETCEKFIPDHKIISKGPNTDLCTDCRDKKKSFNNSEKMRQNNSCDAIEASIKIKELKDQNYNLERQIERANYTKQVMDKIIKCLKEDLEKVRLDAVNSAIEELPPNQKLVVEACFKFANITKQQRRYSDEYYCMCILMRSKSNRLYDYMTNQDIIPLPTRVSLDRQLEGIDMSFGFSKASLNCISQQASRLTASQKLGVVLLDEMSITPSIWFDRTTLKFEGFVNFGDQTKEEDRYKIADHALAIMFQPFQGKWIQVIGMFLSQGAATGDILKELIFEALHLLAHAGFSGIGSTMDGAKWNRKVWSLCGINENSVHCHHPVPRSIIEPSKHDHKLWFFSDFAHLVKCLRNSNVRLEEFWTPDGIVKKKHWLQLLKEDGGLGPNLKMAYKLTPDHLNPKGYQKMNVPMAYQV